MVKLTPSQVFHTIILFHSRCTFDFLKFTFWLHLTFPNTLTFHITFIQLLPTVSHYFHFSILILLLHWFFIYISLCSTFTFSQFYFHFHFSEFHFYWAALSLSSMFIFILSCLSHIHILTFDFIKSKFSLSCHLKALIFCLLFARTRPWNLRDLKSVSFKRCVFHPALLVRVFSRLSQCVPVALFLDPDFYIP